MSAMAEQFERDLAAADSGPSGATDLDSTLAAEGAESVTAYRAQGRPLISVDENGNVSLVRALGRKRQGVAIHIGFDSERAEVWISEKGRNEVVEFKVKKEFLEQLRETAQPEKLPPGVPRDRTKPWRVDVDWPDQYAIPPSLFDQLEKAIVQGSGRVTKAGGG
jgi:hypothetical protein